MTSRNAPIVIFLQVYLHSWSNLQRDVLCNKDTLAKYRHGRSRLMDSSGESFALP